MHKNNGVFCSSGTWHIVRKQKSCTTERTTEDMVRRAMDNAYAKACETSKMIFSSQGKSKQS